MNTNLIKFEVFELQSIEKSKAEQIKKIFEPMIDKIINYIIKG